MFKVFPATLIDGNKIPLIKGWREQATSDPAQIKQWQEFFRERLNFFGVPCGADNNILVLDVDTKKTKNGIETLKQNNFFIPDTLSQRTLNGGIHYIFKFDPSRDPGNKVGFLPGLDIRSSGGWIAWYGVGTDWSKQIFDAPEWLYEEATKKRETPTATTGSVIAIAAEIAQSILQKSLDTIREAPPGESNSILNLESFRVGQLVASSAVTREVAETELFKAAKDRGKPDYEARATIKSGLDGGIKNPLVSPFGTAAPEAAFAIPEPPKALERWTPRHLTRSDLLNTSKLRKPQLFADWSTEDIQITTADGGTGKTTLKLYEAICLALGVPFLGFPCKQRGRTLFITGEDTAEKLGAMIGAILEQMGLFKPSPENEATVETVLNSVIIKKDSDLCLITKGRDNFLRPNDLAMKSILEAVHDLKPKMIVFDPIASFWGSEAALNDMNKAVTRFMSDLVEKSGACVEMINHMGKSSSANKDMTQFAGRGGSGLPSNSRVSRVLRGLSREEYQEMTGSDLVGDTTAMLCNVNKFSDGSPLYNKPFIIIRDRYLFNRIALSAAQVRQIEKEMDDNERIFSFVKQMRNNGKYPTKNVIIAFHMTNGSPMSKDRVVRAIDSTVFFGHMGEKLKAVDNPDLLSKDKVYIVVDKETEKEI